ncbi:MAG: efflux RND transporter periplasmic adaptor subunit [Gammaproteobacteria bacterium]|nr:efflux RND transporter periplasmic adaptor subunit [Gammaproteobacteria bacterium]
MERVTRTTRYGVWLVFKWLEQIFLPNARHMSSVARKQILGAIVLLAVGVPINIYVFSGLGDRQAVAADENSSSHIQAAPVVAAPAMLSELSGDGHNHDSFGNQSISPVNEAPKETAVEHAQKHSNPKFVCPMHPEIVMEDPEADCPICGMDLVPLENTGDSGVVTLAPTVINALGVRLDKVKRRTIYRKIESVGYINYNDNNLRTVSLRTEGWVEKLAVKTTGEKVAKGDLLFQLYSPKLVNSQEEFLQALELGDSANGLIDASRERLRALGVSEQQIARLNDTREVEQLVSFYAPQDGFVTRLNVSEGEFVPPSKSVISIADLSTVWLMVDVFENQIDWVKEGQGAEARLSFMPEKVWEGEVEYIYPSLDARTRSVKARLRFDNPDEVLKPNMYADISIFARPKRQVLTVPREAVIRQGNQTRVITHLGEGKFKPVIIHAGIETDDRIEVVGGLEEDQEVVVSSQFLIDSESSMRAALMRMAGG